MSKVLIRAKGYTLEIKSWENDGDYHNTKYYNTEDLERAKFIHKVCITLFISENDPKKGIGNSMGNARDKIIDFVKSNPMGFDQQIFDSVEGEDFEGMDEDLAYDLVCDLAYELMGSSDYYDFRVCESCTVTYLEEAVYAEEIKF